MDAMVVNWVTGLPLCTRIWTGSILLCSFLVSTNTLHSVDLVFVTSSFGKREWWRLLTTFVYFGPFNMQLLNWLIHIAQHSSEIEQSYISKREYLWYMFVNMVLIVLYSTYVESSQFLGPELVVSTTYYWCRENPEVPMSMCLGLLTFKAKWYPISIILFGILRHGFSHKILTELSGLFAGHLIFFFQEVFVKIYDWNPLLPPWDYFGPTRRNYVPMNNNDVDANANE